MILKLVGRARSRIGVLVFPDVCVVKAESRRSPRGTVQACPGGRARILNHPVALSHTLKGPSALIWGREKIITFKIIWFSIAAGVFI